MHLCTIPPVQFCWLLIFSYILQTASKSGNTTTALDDEDDDGAAIVAGESNNKKSFDSSDNDNVSFQFSLNGKMQFDSVSDHFWYYFSSYTSIDSKFPIHWTIYSILFIHVFMHKSIARSLANIFHLFTRPETTLSTSNFRCFSLFELISMVFDLSELSN